MRQLFLSMEARLTGVAMVGSAVMLMAAATLGMLQVLTRFVFSEPLVWCEALTRFSLIWMVFLAIPTAFRIGAMISVDLMSRLAGVRFRKALSILVAALSIILMVVLLLVGWRYTQSGQYQTIAGLEQFTMFGAYLAVPVGSVFSIIAIIGHALNPRSSELETAQ